MNLVGAERGINTMRFSFALIIVLMVIAVAVQVINLGLDVFRNQHGIIPSDEKYEIITTELRGDRLNIPSNMFRSNENVAGRIGLNVLWPSFKGVQSISDGNPTNEIMVPKIVRINILPHEERLSAVERMNKVYKGLITPPQLKGDDGLIGFNFKENSGFGGQTLYYNPDDQHLTVIRCMTNGSSLAPASCYSSFNFEGRFIVEYSFRKSLLRHWRTIDAAVYSLMLKFTNER